METTTATGGLVYGIRLRQMALEGTEVEGCVSCML